MVNVIGVAKNIGGVVAKNAQKIGKSKLVVECGISTAAGVAGVVGTRIANRLADKSERAIKHAEEKKQERRTIMKKQADEARERSIKSWQGCSCEDMI